MPNSKQANPPPDAVEEDREPTRPPNNSATNNMEQDAAAPGVGHPVVVRRDENSISFRHFLQPHSDVVPSPAPTCRSRNRGAQSGAVDLVDMAMTLPDFVQDHLVVESLSIADHQNDGAPSHSGASSLDLSVLNEILPDFATSQSTSQQPGHSRRRNIQDESPIVPEVSHGATGTSALPDFLSDGPMQCTDTNVVDNTLSGPSTSRSASRILASNSLTERNRIVDESSRSSSFDSSETLRSEVERLRREITERNRRISQLENEIVRLRTNTSTLEHALRVAEQNAVDSATRMESNGESEHSRHRTCTQTGAGSRECVTSTSGGVTTNGGVHENFQIDSHAVRDIAQSSEALLSQLLQNMARLKGMGSVENHRTEDNAMLDPDENKN